MISYLIGADDVDQAKPNPEPVLNVLAALGYESSETLVVGDMDVDILMGVNAEPELVVLLTGTEQKRNLKKSELTISLTA